MIVTATLDLSEGGAKPHLSEDPTTVLLLVTEDHDLGAAFDAIRACRLIREGHVFTTQIHHAQHHFGPVEWRLGHDGEVRGR